MKGTIYLQNNMFRLIIEDDDHVQQAAFNLKDIEVDMANPSDRDPLDGKTVPLRQLRAAFYSASKLFDMQTMLNLAITEGRS